MSFCSGCGLQVDEAARFCSSCGTALSAMIKPASPTTSAVSCPFCGEQIVANARKCRHCGEFVDVALSAVGSRTMPVVGVSAYYQDEFPKNCSKR